MSDHSGIPPIPIFPPFNPTAARPSAPPAHAPGAAEPERPSAFGEPPAHAEPAPPPASGAAGEGLPWEAAAQEPPAGEPPAPAEPMPWDYAETEIPPPSAEPAPWEAAAPDGWGAEEPAAEAEAEESDGLAGPAPEPAAASDEDLPWLEMPAEGPRVHPVEETPLADSIQWSEAEGGEDTPVGRVGFNFPELSDRPAETPSVPLPWETEAPETAVSEAGAPEAAEEPGVTPIGELEFAEPHPLVESALPWSEPPSVVEPEPAGAAPETATAEASVSGTPSGEVPGALEEVAGRLEGIARALREDPARFLSGEGAASDPLALLVTGFVLGYTQPRGGS
jgi:hypothetical protein